MNGILIFGVHNTPVQLYDVEYDTQLDYDFELEYYKKTIFFKIGNMPRSMFDFLYNMSMPFDILIENIVIKDCLFNNKETFTGLGVNIIRIDDSFLIESCVFNNKETFTGLGAGIIIVDSDSFLLSKYNRTFWEFDTGKIDTKNSKKVKEIKTKIKELDKLIDDLEE